MLRCRSIDHRWSPTPKAIVILRLISNKINQYNKQFSQRWRHHRYLNPLRKQLRMMMLLKVRILMQRLSSFRNYAKSWIRTPLQQSWRAWHKLIPWSKRRKSKRIMIERQRRPRRTCMTIMGRPSQLLRALRRQAQHSNRMTTKHPRRVSK